MWKASREPVVTLIMNRSRRLGNCTSNAPYCCVEVAGIDNLMEEGLVSAHSLGDDKGLSWWESIAAEWSSCRPAAEIGEWR